MTNTGSLPDTYTLTPSGIISGTAHLTPATVALGPGQSQTVQLTAGPLPFALARTDPFAVTAWSQANPAIQNAGTGDITFTGYHAVQVALQPASRTLTTPSRTTYLLVITNTGNLDSDYAFTSASTPAGLTFSPRVRSLEVPAHMTSVIPLEVQSYQAGTYTLSVRADASGGVASGTAAGTLIVEPIVEPTSTPTATATPAPTATSTRTPGTTTPAATATSTPTPTPTATATVTFMPTSMATGMPVTTATGITVGITASVTPTPPASVPPTRATTSTAVSSMPTSGPPVHAMLRLDRALAAVGDRLCATGAGFLAREPATVAVDAIAVAQIATDGAGGFTACFATPGNIVAGSNDVTATGARSGSVASASFGGVFARAQASTAYFVGADTAGGDETELDLVNPRRQAARVVLCFYRPDGSPFERAIAVPAQARATLLLSRYVRGVRSVGLCVRADQVIATQMIVRRGHKNPYTSLGTGLLSRQWYLAEGYTNLTFHEVIDVLNPNSAATTVQVRLLPFNGRGPAPCAFACPPSAPTGST